MFPKSFLNLCLKRSFTFETINEAKREILKVNLVCYALRPEA